MFELVPATCPVSRSQPARIVRNVVLSTLTEADFALLRPHLRAVELRRHDIVHDAFRSPDAVYFIESGLISRVVRSPKDGTIEVANVGRCGFIGVSVVLGTMIAIQRTVVLVPGVALGIDAATLRAVMAERPSIKEHLLKYVQVLMALNAQISMCNAKHELSERVARWLLLASDLIESDLLPVTHGLVAEALGVRRPGVSVALGQLERRGILARTRGALRIMDYDGLRRVGCECHQVVRHRFQPFNSMPRHQHSL